MYCIDKGWAHRIISYRKPKELQSNSEGNHECLPACCRQSFVTKNRTIQTNIINNGSHSLSAQTCGFCSSFQIRNYDLTGCVYFSYHIFSLAEYNRINCEKEYSLLINVMFKPSPFLIPLSS